MTDIWLILQVENVENQVEEFLEEQTTKPNEEERDPEKNAQTVKISTS